jgi:hypothetical protein
MLSSPMPAQVLSRLDHGSGRLGLAAHNERIVSADNFDKFLWRELRFYIDVEIAFLLYDFDPFVCERIADEYLHGSRGLPLRYSASTFSAAATPAPGAQ